MQHLQVTLPQNLNDNADYPNAVFVVLDYNSQDDLESWLKSSMHSYIESGRLVVYKYPDAGQFQMAHAKNMVHRLGILEGADILVNLDADNFTRRGFAHYIAKKFAEVKLVKKDLFLWTKWNLPGMAEGTRIPKGCGGRIVVTKNTFLKSGGYDEKYSTWGPDDKDFNARLTRMGYPKAQIDRVYLDAVLHNDKVRFREYKHAQEEMDAYQFESVHANDNTVVNFGRIGLGIVYRNFSKWPTTLDVLPTRIFGIGMHKTATSSLNDALNILGLDSAHWEDAHWAKAIWQEMMTNGRSDRLEGHYSLTDLPITLLYKELDKAYPNSKFILTVRDDQDWLQSVRNHWSYDRNKFRHQWGTDPFTHRVHKLLYGQKSFDADIFLSRYRRHNAEVKEYFKHRPQDLLILDMTLESKWDYLCDFLDCAVPDVEYPWNRSTTAPRNPPPVPEFRRSVPDVEYPWNSTTAPRNPPPITIKPVPELRRSGISTFAVSGYALLIGVLLIFQTSNYLFGLLGVLITFLVHFSVSKILSKKGQKCLDL